MKISQPGSLDSSPGRRASSTSRVLQKSATHAPMVRYYHPDEFADLKREALDMGFVHVESGPLVRSSYHANDTADAYAAAAAR